MELTTCTYLLMQKNCWLNVLFVLIFSIYLFTYSNDVNNSSASHHFCLFTYGNPFLITCGFRLNIHYLFIYLFKTMSTKAGGSDHLFLFTYGNRFLITCGFCLNIHYLFLYLFKAMSTKAGGSDHLFLSTYGNHFLLLLVFVLIFIIYLFIYSKRYQQKQVCGRLVVLRANSCSF